MRFADLFASALKGVSVHKGRAVLTMLGIIIGVSSIMVVMSVGEGASIFVLSEFQSFGPTVVFVLPGKKPSGVMDVSSSLLADSLKLKDVEDLQDPANVPDAIRVIPYAFGIAEVEYESELVTSTILGSTPDAQDSFSLDMASGRFFDETDVDNKTRVAVIGKFIQEELFGLEDPIDKKIRVGNTLFRVIGVLESRSASFVNFNESIIAPYPPVQQDVLGTRHFQRVAVEAGSVDQIEGMVKDIEALLRDNHNIDDPEEDNFFVNTQENVAEGVKSITAILTVLLASVAGISLVVGGVGIMNVMFVSVTERTREIGLRKALGATNRSVLWQFLIEAALLTLVGGVIGVVLGGVLTYVAIWGAATFADIAFPFVLSVQGIVWGVGVSVAVGLFFGIFPARSAARKSPIEALRQS